MHIKKQLKCIVAIWDLGLGTQTWDSDLGLGLGTRTWNSDLELGLGTRTWDSELEARDFETETQETVSQEPELLTQDF